MHARYPEVGKNDVATLQLLPPQHLADPREMASMKADPGRTRSVLPAWLIVDDAVETLCRSLKLDSVDAQADQSARGPDVLTDLAGMPPISYRAVNDDIAHNGTQRR